MARIVHTAFTFNDAEGVHTQFKVGEEVPDEIADHWYVQHHSDEPKKGKGADKKPEVGEGGDK